MFNAPKIVEVVSVSRIFLLLSNPRHVPFDSESEAITYLCQKENVYALARDLVKYGLSPLERFALVAIDKRKIRGSGFYVVEGNRRICAVKLLSDPDLAPANLRKGFEKLAEEWTPITTVSGAVFDAIEDVDIWLDRIHNGTQGGIGRKEWNAEQKQRFDGGSKNKAAQALLDYAESEQMITPEEREGKLTTVQRFIGNNVFRETIGFDQENADEVGRTRPKAEFDILVKRFIRDLLDGKDVNSRMNKDAIIRYARPLNSLASVTSTRIETESLSTSGAGKKGKSRRKKPRKPEKAKHMRYEEEIFVALKSFGNEKLSSLYHSICAIELDPHTPIVAIGTWSFFETLTACAGRNDNTNFVAFLSKAKLKNYGMEDSLTALHNALDRILANGNNMKHHRISAIFNGDQLNNDFMTLKNVTLKIIEEAASKTS